MWLISCCHGVQILKKFLEAGYWWCCQFVKHNLSNCVFNLLLWRQLLFLGPGPDTKPSIAGGRKNCDEQSSGQCWAGSAKGEEEQRIHQISGSLFLKHEIWPLEACLLHIQYGGNFRLHVKYRGWCPFRAPRNQYWMKILRATSFLIHSKEEKCSSSVLPRRKNIGAC